MRLDDLDPSDNARDLGTGGGGLGGFGGGGGLGGGLIGLLPLLLGRRMGCGTILLIGVVGFFLYSSGMLGGGGAGLSSGAPAVQQGQSGGNVACDTAEERFACQVLRSTEQTWGKIFAASGERYEPTTLNFFRNNGESGCGAAQSAMGPFYCPTDKGVYLDTVFFQELSQRFGAAGDFAQAYVIAHEVGHHIQTLTGISAQVRQRQQAARGEAEGNALQVRMELQADCYAGVWAGQNRDRIEAGDLQEGLTAAQAIGDDTLQRSAGQRPVPESFTHGTSEQRQRWLKRGFDSADPQQCDTFAAGAV